MALASAASDLTKRIELFYAAFCAAMNAVLLADDAFGFLFFWEFMSLGSWALVVSRHEDADSRKAGYVYLVMAAIGTVALLFAFGGMAGSSGGYAFDSIRAHHLTPFVSALVLAAALSERARKPASCRSMRGCRSRIPQRQAMSPHS